MRRIPLLIQPVIKTKINLNEIGHLYFGDEANTFAEGNDQRFTNSRTPEGAAGGELSGTYPNPVLVNSSVIGKILTGYVSGAGTILATDTILQAIQKLNGNIAGTTLAQVMTVGRSVDATGTILTSGGLSSLDINNRVAIDPGSINSIKWGTGLTGRTLYDTAGTKALVWKNTGTDGSFAAYYNGGSFVSFDLGLGYAYDSSGNKVMDLTLRQMQYGQWAYNADYSGTYTSRSIVDKAYVDGVAAGYVPLTRSLTINGSSQTLAADRIWTITTTGTANRITVTGGTGLTPTVDISSSYVGQATITTLGTIGTGVWQGTSISTTYTDAKVKTVTGGASITIGGTTTDPTFAINTSWVGQAAITTLGTITTGTWTATKVGLAYGGTNSDLSATGGTSNYLKQVSAGAAITVGTIPASDIGSGAALTKTDDTNVTITLGGTPTTALLAATSLTLGWTGQLGLTRGGTATSLTASNGGIVYSTSSALAILSGTATASKMLLSGSSTTPAWSTSTVPSSAGATAGIFLNSDGTNYILSAFALPTTIAQGDLLYGSSATVISKLAKSTGTSNFLKNSGTSNNPAWAQPATTDLSDTIIPTNYSATSTVVGWSSTTEKQIVYSIVGKNMNVWIRIVGTSNSTAITITIPSTSIAAGPADISGFIAKAVDNGGTAAFGRCRILASTSTIDFYKDADGSAWTNSGTKSVQATIIIPIQ